MSDINQNVNINVNADTQGAGQEINRLENNIKTLDGAVNLVGGSIEVLAGSLALTGAVTEEQAERFETAAVGAIALADGAKRALEGFKVLATETKLAATAQRIFNAAVNANPIAILVTALATVGAAYVAFRNSQRDNADTVEDTNEQLQAQIDLLNKQATLGADVKLNQLTASAKARNITTREAIELEREQAKAVVDAQNREALRLKSLRGSARLDQEQLELQIQQAEARKNNAQAALDLLEKVDLLIAKNAEEAKKKRETNRAAREKEKEDQEKALQDAFDAEQDYYDRVNDLLMTEEEARILNTAKMYDNLIEEAAQYGYDTTELEAAREAAIQAVIDDAAQERADKADEERQKELDKQRAFRQQLSDLAVDSALGTLSALKDLNSIFDAENEEAQKKAFQREKALNIAETIISTYSAAQKAFASQLIPGDPTSIVRGQIAAGVAIAGGLARVAVISAQKFDSPSTAGGGGAAAGVGGIPSAGGGGQQVTGVPAIPGAQYGDSGITTLNAVVLSGEMTSAQAQDAAIRSRRRFGRGG